MNAFYGVFASTFYRFTNPEIGAAITAFARQNIKDIINLLENEGIEVIYSDTDSIFFRSPYESVDQTLEFGNGISKRFSKHGAILEFEKILEPFFSHGKKKRYVGKVVWPKEEILIRGYETRRTDAFDLQSEALRRIFDLVLSGRLDEVVAVSRELISKIQQGDVPVEKLVISKTAKSPKAYKNPDSQANVQAMLKLKKLGYEFIPGMKVSYIVTNSRKTPQEVEPFIDGRPFEDKPDWDYYAERVATSLARVTEVFGWDERTLLTGVQQRSLFSKDFEGATLPTDDSDLALEKSLKKARAEKARAKKAKKKAFTLDDFM
jgi:DNA polymerase I